GPGRMWPPCPGRFTKPAPFDARLVHDAPELRRQAVFALPRFTGQRREHRSPANAAYLLFPPRSELRVHRHDYILARLAGRDGDCSFRDVYRIPSQLSDIA